MKIVKIALILLIMHLSCKADDDRQINFSQKEKNAVTLVKKAIEFISRNSLDKAFDAFLEDSSWRSGELCVIVLNDKGTVLLDPNDSRNIYTTINEFSKIKQVIKNGGGWVQYKKNNRIFSAYAEKISIKKKKYIVHAGYFSLSAKDAVLHAVANVENYFLENGLDKTINAINKGIFERQGSVLPFICSIDGMCVAYQDHPELVGKNIYLNRTPDGQDTLKRINEIFESPTLGDAPLNEGWIDYIVRFEKKRDYLKKLNENYFVGAGFYPATSKKGTISLVEKGKAYIYSNGPEEAFKAFSDKDGIFIKGYQDITVFDMDGKAITSAFSPDWVGKNMLRATDEFVQPYIKKIFEQVEIDETAWVSYINNNQNWTIYAERVDTPSGKYILASGYHPYNKEDATKNLVNEVIAYFEENGPELTFQTLAMENTPFTFADLSIFIYDMNGNCLINGSHSDLIHQNFLGLQDQSGKSIVADIITAANLDDEAWLKFNINNAQRRVFVNNINESTPTKEGDLEYYRSYVIGSGYFM